MQTSNNTDKDRGSLSELAARALTTSIEDEDEREVHYHEWRHERNKPYIALSLQCGAIAFLLFAYNDLQIYESWLSNISSTLQGLFLAPLLLYMSFRVIKGEEREIARLSLLGGLAALITLSTILIFAQFRGVYLPYEGLLVIMLFIFLLSGATPRTGVVCSLPVFTYYFTSMWIAGADLGRLTTQLVFMLVTFLVGYLGASNREMANRRIYDMSMELISQATTDDLTGLSNRRVLNKGVANAWGIASRSGEPLGMLFVDIDFFKRLNDNQGHAAGDAALTRVAHRLAKCVSRPMDIVGRLGGEEFVIVALGADQPGLLKISEDIHRSIANEAIEHPDSPLGDCLTVSVGAVSVQPATSDQTVEQGIESLWLAADSALYTAKQSGRNQTCFAEPSATAASTDPAKASVVHLWDFAASCAQANADGRESTGAKGRFKLG